MVHGGVIQAQGEYYGGIIADDRLGLNAVNKSGQGESKEVGHEDGIGDHFLENLLSHMDERMDVEVEEPPDPDELLNYMGLLEVEVFIQLHEAEEQGKNVEPYGRGREGRGPGCDSSSLVSV